MARYREELLDHTSPPVHGRSRELTSREKWVLARLTVNGGTKTAKEAARLVILRDMMNLSLFQSGAL